MTRGSRAFALTTLLGAVLVAGAGRAGSAPPLGTGRVYWIPVDDGPHATQGMIDDWMFYFVERHIARAGEEGATAIVFGIRTYGGEGRAAEAIADAVIAVGNVPTIAYVDGRALSAGALIALACDYVYMREDSTMGDVQAVMATEEGPKPLGEKVDTHMRARFRMQARRRAGRIPYEEQYLALFEAMTDASVVVLRVKVDEVETFVRESELERFTRDREAEGKTVTVLDTVVRAGELLTMDSTEALDEYRIIDGIVKDRAGLLKAIGRTEADVMEAAASWPQEIARFVGGSLISGLLISIAMLGLLMELYAPGKGVGGFIFLFGIILFFWSHFLAGQAGPVEVVLFLFGVALLAAEIFLIPGFGVTGIAGIVLMVASLVLAFLPGDVMPGGEAVPIEAGRVGGALLTVFASLLVSVIGIIVLARYLPHVPLFRGMVLEQESGPAAAGAGAAPKGDLERFVGRRGVAITDLRPAGKAEIEGEPVDVVAEAEFLGKGEAVEVLEVSGNRVVVARAGGRARGGEA